MALLIAKNNSKIILSLLSVLSLVHLCLFEPPRRSWRQIPKYINHASRTRLVLLPNLPFLPPSVITVANFIMILFLTHSRRVEGLQRTEEYLRSSPSFDASLVPSDPSFSSSSAAIPPQSVSASHSTIRETQGVRMADFSGTFTTNQSLANVLCGSLDNQDGFSVTNIITQSNYPMLPACVANFPMLKTVLASKLLITDFSVLYPASIITLNLQDCQFAPLPTNPNLDGFDAATGKIDWNEVFALLPHLQTLVIGDFVGTMPTTAPANLTSLYLIGSSGGIGLTGSLSPTLFPQLSSAPSTLTSFSLRITGRLSGSIPETLFASASQRAWSSFLVMLTSNRLSGSIPPNLLSSLASAGINSFSLDLSDNLLAGSLPANLFPADMLSASGVSLFQFSVRSNIGLSGHALLPSWFTSLTSVQSFSYDASYCGFTGTIPQNIFSSPGAFPTAVFSLNLRSNQIEGSIPPHFMLPTSTEGNYSLFTFTMDLRSNQLSGTIPDDLFFSNSLGKRHISQNEKVDVSKRSFRESKVEPTADASYLIATLQWVVNLDSNMLQGSLPATLFMPAFFSPDLADSAFTASSNRLSGTMPPNLLSSYPNTAALGVTVRLDKNQISGSLPAACLSTASLTFSATENLLNGTIPTQWQACKFATLLLADNPSISGTIPPAFFSSGNLSIFTASNTALSGTLPPITSSLTSFDLSLTAIDFCSSPSNTSIGASWTGGCVVSHSSACDCAEVYLPHCTVGCEPIEPVVIPTTTPITPPTIAPSPVTVQCLGPSPSSDFTCVNGTWIAPSTNVSVLVIPSGVGTVIVTGNVTSGSIVFNGLASNITITGCANNLTVITVELTPEEAEKLGKTTILHNLITLVPSALNGGNCTTNLNNVELIAKVKDSCKKIATTKVVSAEGNSFGGYFTLDSSGCNRWWIILVSVLVPVVIIAVAAAIVARVIWTRNNGKKHSERLHSSGTRG